MWLWSDYELIEDFFCGMPGRGRRLSVVLDDSVGRVTASSIRDAERHVHCLGANPRELTVEAQRRNGLHAELTVRSTDSGVTTVVRFVSQNEVEARGLKCALDDRLERVRPTRSSPLPRHRRSWSRLMRTVLGNVWFVGVTTGVIAGAILFALTRG